MKSEISLDSWTTGIYNVFGLYKLMDKIKGYVYVITSV